MLVCEIWVYEEVLTESCPGIDRDHEIGVYSTPSDSLQGPPIHLVKSKGVT